MLSALTLAALSSAANAAQILTTDVPVPHRLYQGPFGNQVEETTTHDLVHKNVSLSNLPYHMDYEAQTRNLDYLTSKLQGSVSNDQPIYTCDTRMPLAPGEAFNFLPVYNGAVSESNPKASFTGKCFDYDVTYVPVDDSSFDLLVTTSNKQSATCRDNILFANTEIRHIESFYFKGDHKITINVPADGKPDLQFGGIKLYHFCSGFVGEIESLFHTLEAFVGGLSDHPNLPFIGSHTPPYMEKANIRFIEAAMGIQIEDRPIYQVDIPEDQINSGDFFLIQRLDGLDPMIMWGTGGRGAHCVMALRFEGELYIIESQDAWYWPTAGIQRTPWAKWIKQADEASFNIILMPLSEASRAKFDVQKAQDWFFQTEGLPYGYHNFLYGWMDTPRDNLPPSMPNEMIPIIFSMVENVMPHSVYNIFVEALDKRLGNTGCQTVACIANLAAEQGMSVQDVIAIPEQDGWLYEGLPVDGMAFVCSAYSASVYKAAGMFDDFEVNATEFTPRDVYLLDFFDKNYERPQVCVDADPNLPYCQVMGKYRIDVSAEWSTVAPYEHMMEHCATVGPEYVREPYC